MVARKSLFAIAMMFILPLSYNACGGFQATSEMSLSSLGGGSQEIPTERPPASARFKFQCQSPGSVGAENAGIRRLTKSELTNTLKSILGETIYKDATISSLVAGIPDSESGDPTETSTTHSPDFVVGLLGVADRLVQLVGSQQTVRTQLFGNCASYDETCASNFIKSFGAKVFRRPMASAEVTKELEFFRKNGSGQKGMTALLFKFIQSPPLAFHVEVGQAVQGGRTRLTDYEIASRISYQTVSSPPDQELLNAAKEGKLQNLVEVKNHVERLLSAGSTVARNRLDQFFTYYADIGNVPDPFQAVASERGILTFGLGDEMAEETKDYLNHIFWTTKGSFYDMMTSRESFPRSENLRKILGASKVVGSDGKPVLADGDHVGLLHRPALLASVLPRTSPILRGAHVRVKFLCDKLPGAPADAVNAVLSELGDIENQTNRAKTDQITGGPACISCHSLINPLGYAFEGYDQLGIRRSQEKAIDDKEAVIGTFPIDTRVSNPMIETGVVGGTMNDSIEVAMAMANGSKARSCYAERTFEFIHRRSVNSNVDGCALEKVESVSHTGSLRDVLVHAIANEGIFWRHAKN